MIRARALVFHANGNITHALRLGEPCGLLGRFKIGLRHLDVGPFQQSDLEELIESQWHGPVYKRTGQLNGRGLQRRRKRLGLLRRGRVVADESHLWLFGGACNDVDVVGTDIQQIQNIACGLVIRGLRIQVRLFVLQAAGLHAVELKPAASPASTRTLVSCSVRAYWLSSVSAN